MFPTALLLQSHDRIVKSCFKHVSDKVTYLLHIYNFVFDICDLFLGHRSLKHDNVIILVEHIINVRKVCGNFRSIPAPMCFFYWWKVGEACYDSN